MDVTPPKDCMPRAEQRAHTEPQGHCHLVCKCTSKKGPGKETGLKECPLRALCSSIPFNVELPIYWGLGFPVLIQIVYEMRGHSLFQNNVHGELSNILFGCRNHFFTTRYSAAFQMVTIAGSETSKK